MSLQNALDFFKAIQSDNTVNAALAQCTSLEDVQMMAKALGTGSPLKSCASVYRLEHASHRKRHAERLGRSLSI